MTNELCSQPSCMRRARVVIEAATEGERRVCRVCALIAEVARLKAERELTRQALLAYTEQHGWEHDIYASGDDEVECPEGDTCECPYFPALNAAMKGPHDH